MFTIDQNGQQIPVTIAGDIAVENLQQSDLGQLQVDSTNTVDYSQFIEVPTNTVQIIQEDGMLGQPLQTIASLPHLGTPPSIG